MIVFVLELLKQEMVDRIVDFLLIQHTGAKKDDVLDIGDLPVTLCIHGATQGNNHIHRGVGISLSRRAYRVWVEAGQEEAVKSDIIVGTTRYMSMDLDWEDISKRTME